MFFVYCRNVEYNSRFLFIIAPTFDQLHYESISVICNFVRIIFVSIALDMKIIIIKQFVTTLDRNGETYAVIEQCFRSCQTRNLLLLPFLDYG